MRRICASRFRLRWHSIHPLMAARRDRGSVDATAACGTSCALRPRLPQGSGAIRFGRGHADRTRSFLAGCRSSCGAWRKLCYQRRFRSILCEFDLLLAPTVPCVAWPLVQLGPKMIGGKEASPRAHAAFTPFVNHARLPAISIPCGRDASGLPFGIQIIARRGQDRLSLRAAKRIEYETVSVWAKADVGGSLRSWRWTHTLALGRWPFQSHSIVDSAPLSQEKAKQRRAQFHRTTHQRSPMLRKCLL